MFGKKYELTLNRVHDTVLIREGDEKLELRVDGDPMRMVAGLGQAQKKMQALDKDSTDEETDGAARYFAQVIFGEAQAERLVEFYHNDAGCVISVCGKYFESRLGKLITKAQKRAAGK